MKDATPARQHACKCVLSYLCTAVWTLSNAIALLALTQTSTAMHPHGQSWQGLQKCALMLVGHMKHEYICLPVMGTFSSRSSWPAPPVVPLDHAIAWLIAAEVLC